MRRGFRDEEAFITAGAILERGGCMAMYCEGGRSRSGRIGDRARPGIGRLALESGATIVPVAIHGSERVRNWKRLRFPKVTVQYGEPFRYERVAEPTRDQQQAVADEILDAIKASTPARRRGPPGRRRAGRARAARARGRSARRRRSAGPAAAPGYRRTSSQSAAISSVASAKTTSLPSPQSTRSTPAADRLDAVVARRRRRSTSSSRPP